LIQKNHTVNTGQPDATQSCDLEEPYYFTVSTGQPDAIEVKQNDACGIHFGLLFCNEALHI